MRVSSGEGGWRNMLRKGVMLFGRYGICLWDHMLLAAKLKMRGRKKGLMEYVEKGR
jgi:hypothetical protein